MTKYEIQLFNQQTLYGQWLKSQDKTLESVADKGQGKQYALFPLFTCMDEVSVEQMTSTEYKDADYIVFSRKDGYLDSRWQQIFDSFILDKKSVQLIYCDEDYLDTFENVYPDIRGLDENSIKEQAGQLRYKDTGLVRGYPWFKPDYSPDTLETFFYIGRIFAVKKKLIVDMFDSMGRDSASIYEILLRAKIVKLTRENVVHIPYVLFTNSTAKDKDSIEGFGKNPRYLTMYKDTRPHGRVSVIIPSKDNEEVLSHCLTSLIKYTNYDDVEIIIVDNGSTQTQLRWITSQIESLQSEYRGVRIKHIYEPMDFNFSKMCNMGAAASTGKYLLFLNDDIEVLREEPDWMAHMVNRVMMATSGAVGAKLLYPKLYEADRTKPYRIQHVGITNMGIGPAHKLSGLEDEGNLYHGHNLVDYNMLAVTGACLMIRRDVFDDIEGFDESLPIAYNDVELCFRLYKEGYYNVVCNSAVLIHHESFTRGQDITPQKRERLGKEKEKLYSLHPELKGKDPFYSPNLVQNEKDVLFRVGSIYEDKKHVLLNTKPVKLPLVFNNKFAKKLSGTDKAMLSIDEIIREDGQLRVRGWSLIQGKDNSCISRKILFRDASKKDVVYSFDLAPTLRTDILDVMGSVATGIALCGIDCIISEDDLPRAQLQVGVLSQTPGNRKYLVWS